MKKTVDYQKLRGFNYTQPDAVNDRDFWANYHHDIVDRDMGYAERLHLNSARIFLSYDFYKENPDRFLANVKDFVQTAFLQTLLFLWGSGSGRMSSRRVDLC